MKQNWDCWIGTAVMSWIIRSLMDVENGFGNVWVRCQLGERKQQIVNGRFVSLPKMDVCVSKVCLLGSFFANCIYILLWMSKIMKEVENDRAKAYLILYTGNMKKKLIWKRNDGLWCKFGKMVKALPWRDAGSIVRYLVFLFLLLIGKHFGLYCLPGRDTGRHW